MSMMNKVIVFLAFLAIVLTLALWLTSEATEGSETLHEEPTQVEADSLMAESDGYSGREAAGPTLIEDGDSLWVWNDTFMEFEFSRFMSDEKIVGIPVTDSDGDGVLDLTWKSLQAIHYAREYFDDFGMEVYIPAFPNDIKALDGQKIEVQGFTIPFDGEEAFVALSATPFANCFFCGKGSPASVISLYLEDPEKVYKVDDFKRFEGRLRLNHDDPEEFYYVLEDAREVR